MASLWRTVTCSVRNLWQVGSVQQRTVTLSATMPVKKITAVEDGDTLTIEGHIVPSPREGRVIQVNTDRCACPLCQLNLNIKHTDVLILSQFLRSDGCLIPRRVSGVCRLQQRRIQQLVAMSQKAGLMPNLAPASSKRDPKLRFGYKKFNKYYDETTIKDVKPFASLEGRRGAPPPFT